MAFKVKRFIPDPSPINLVDPGKVLKAVGASIFPVANTVVDTIKGVSETVKAYKTRNYKAPVDSEPKIKVKSQVTKDGESGYEADDRARKNKTGIYAPKQKETVKRRKKASTIEVSKAKKIKSTIEATPKASDVNVSKKPTVKTAPKDNSRKAIRKRKKADKAAGVSKSQMRANKAKSKSEAASAKAKKSKNPSYRAQLTAKSERLAKRAKRKGGSPVKAISGPGDGVKMRTDAEILKQYPGAVKVKGKLNEFKYKGATLNPSRYPVSDKGKTVKQAIEIKNKK
jgi:hypothetical protein